MNRTIDPTPSEAFKRYGSLDIAGNIAVADGEGTVQWASSLPGYADGYRPGVESRTAMDFLEAIATSPSNRICVECLHLLDGDETFCPNCGHELPYPLPRIREVLESFYLNTCSLPTLASLLAGAFVPLALVSGGRPVAEITVYVTTWKQEATVPPR